MVFKTMGSRHSTTKAHGIKTLVLHDANSTQSPNMQSHKHSKIQHTFLSSTATIQKSMNDDVNRSTIDRHTQQHQ